MNEKHIRTPQVIKTHGDLLLRAMQEGIVPASNQILDVDSTLDTPLSQSAYDVQAKADFSAKAAARPDVYYFG